MNVTYDNFNSSDVAKILGVAPQTVTYYVRHGFMKAVDMSDGSSKGRYMFTDDEVTRVQKLMKEHGKYSWTKYVRNDVAPVEEPTVEVNDTHIEEDVHDTGVVITSFDSDKLMNKILKLKELEEESYNLKARYNQVCKEITMLKEEIISQL